MSLFLLVEDVLVFILTRWIAMKEIGNLDSAVCNFQQRSLFLDLIKAKGAQFLCVHELIQVGPHYIVWLGLRKVSVAQLDVCDVKVAVDVVFKNDYISLFQLKILKIKGVFVDDSLPFTDVASRCSSLEVLVVRACLNNIDSLVSAFVHHCPTLSCLVIGVISTFLDSRGTFRATKNSGCRQPLTSKGLHNILKCGVNLTTLILNNIDGLTLTNSEYEAYNECNYLGCCNLIQLNVYGCIALTDKDLHTLTKNCSKLQFFDCHSCPLITDTSIASVVTNNHDLKHIVCSLTLAGDDTISAVAEHCPQVESCSFNMLKNISDTAVIALAEKCTKITSLCLKDAPGVTDLSLEAIARHLTSLTALQVGRTNDENQQGFFCAEYALSNSALRSVVAGCATDTVHTFDFTECGDIDSTIRLIAKKCPMLRSLNITSSLSNPNNITENTMMLIAKNCSELTNLVAIDCLTCITDVSLTSLAAQCPKLVWLNIMHTKVTDESIAKIAECSSNLQWLNIMGCYMVTSQAVVAVTVGCPLLSKLVTCCMTGSLSILNSVVLNSPFLMELSVSEDMLAPTLFAAAVKNVQSQFPRCRLSIATIAYVTVNGVPLNL